MSCSSKKNIDEQFSKTFGFKIRFKIRFKIQKIHSKNPLKIQTILTGFFEEKRVLNRNEYLFFLKLSVIFVITIVNFLPNGFSRNISLP